MIIAKNTTTRSVTSANRPDTLRALVWFKTQVHETKNVKSYVSC